MYQIPTSLEFNGGEHKICNDGDYRMVLDCFSALNDSEIDEQQRLMACLVIFYDEIIELEDLKKLGDLNIATQKMFDFFRCNQPEAPQAFVYRLIDWKQDEQMICSAINPIANQEIRSMPYLHWWTFMGYYNAIGKSVLSTVVSIRNKLMRGDKMEKWERKFKIENPQYFNWQSGSADKYKEDEEIRELWNKNS